METLKEFRNILLGQQIKVYTDHKNITCKSFNTNRVMRWRLIIEEYGPELIYIKGTQNIIADALSRLDKSQLEVSDKTLSDLFATTPTLLEFPFTYKNIHKEQQKDRSLLQVASSDSTYSVKQFHGGGKTRHLIVRQDKIVLPRSLQMQCVKWYQ